MRKYKILACALCVAVLCHSTQSQETQKLVNEDEPIEDSSKRKYFDPTQEVEESHSTQKHLQSDDPITNSLASDNSVKDVDQNNDVPMQVSLKENKKVSSENLNIPRTSDHLESPELPKTPESSEPLETPGLSNDLSATEYAETQESSKTLEPLTTSEDKAAEDTGEEIDQESETDEDMPEIEYISSGQPIGEGFPDPVEINNLDKSSIKRVSRVRIDRDTLHTTVQFVPDRNGHVRTLKYVQSRMPSGDVISEDEEYWETGTLVSQKNKDNTLEESVRDRIAAGSLGDEEEDSKPEPELTPKKKKVPTATLR